jgi:hypothetical protein
MLNTNMSILTIARQRQEAHQRYISPQIIPNDYHFARKLIVSQKMLWIILGLV